MKTMLPPPRALSTGIDKRASRAPAIKFRLTAPAQILFGRRFDAHAVRGAGIADDDIEATKVVRRHGHQALQVSQPGDIGDARGHVNTARREIGLDCCQAILAARRHHQAATFGGQLVDDGPPDPARRARHQRHFPR